MDVFEGIYTRRSVRDFSGMPVEKEKLQEILKAGSWAPSGLNNQPWRFAVVSGSEKRAELAGLTRYSRILLQAPVAIAVFADHSAMYNDTKDQQAIGACIQNMLLAAHALGLGAVWLGEILKNAGAVRDVLELSEHLELMAVLAVGYPDRNDQVSTRKMMPELLVKEF
ncbi:MAG: nitroreductase family protein [Deltaproteobacteria bacterium]|nr:nitroreductase family protein [Deltaproteobacteria bacterium]TLN02958.1 MAG: nitroreductase family protein [bacterium]